MATEDSNIQKQLRKAGLAGKEAAVYAALLQAGGAYPSKVAELTKLNRSTTYKVLENLAVKGLVSELEKRNKLFYQVENPKSLERHAQSRITLAKRDLESMQALLPTLEGLYSHAANKPIVRFFEGKEGVLKVFEDHVSGKGPYEMLAFANTADLLKFLPEKFIHTYIRRKEKLSITARAVLPYTEVDVDYSKTIYAGYSKKIWPKVRHVPQKLFPYKSDITVYGINKVSIINFSGPQFAATIIEDKTIHDMMVMIFELAWAGVSSSSKT
ncbi:MAG: helix-turn-helix domain-containing protein [Candidatus Andersenbacteria bacterium]